jgi:hypothetical protein
MGTEVMSFLSERGQSVAQDVASRHGVSVDAVTVLLRALVAGHGNQAQFNHPDLGGMGQWSRGGMIMVGDMFNNALKARVDALCNDLSQHLRSDDLFAQPGVSSQSQSQSGGAQATSLFVSGPQSGNWWPDTLGAPASVGSQNNLRYAFFPATRRLAIDLGGRLTVYDTGDHRIGGFSQQQSGDQSLTFTSQHGLVRVADLPKVEPDDAQRAAAPAAREDTSSRPSPAGAAPKGEASAESPSGAANPGPSSQSGEDVIAKIERLASLHQRGILTQSEFDAKKAELLAKI